MKLPEASILLLGASAGPAAVGANRDIKGVPAPNHHIHAERDVDNLAGDSWTPGQVRVVSTVPATVHMNSDDYFDGEQPIFTSYAKILVTSDCATDDGATHPVPEIIVGDDGSITVNIDVPKDEAEAMPFLEPSSFDASWSASKPFCGGQWGGGMLPPSTGIPFEEPEVEGVKCEIGPQADPTKGCDENAGEFCQLAEGLCINRMGIHNGVCTTKPEVCGEIFAPVCGCDGGDYGNDCEARAAGTSVRNKGKCDSPAQPLPDPDGCAAGTCLNPNTGECEGEVQCFADPCDSSPCGDGELCASNYCGGCNAVCSSSVPPPPPDNTCPEFQCLDPDGDCGVPQECDKSVVCAGECEDGTEVCTVNSCGGCYAVCTPEFMGLPASPTCPTTLDSRQAVGNNAEMYYALVPSSPPDADNGILCVRLEVKGDNHGWIGFGISPDGNMKGQAVVGVVNSDTVSKYDLDKTTSPAAALAPEERQTLAGTSIVQEGGFTTMEFTKLLVEDGEVPILEDGVNHFLFAFSDSPTFGYHGRNNRMSFEKDFADDVQTIDNPTVTVVPPIVTQPIVEPETCGRGTPCTVSGSTCEIGSETCCGVTSPSMKCRCRAETMLYDICSYTEACMFPSCCMSGPPADKPPPTADTCSRAGPACTPEEGEGYCCNDFRGSGLMYCAVSGGKPEAILAPPTTTEASTTDATTQIAPQVTTEETTTAATTVATADPTTAAATPKATTTEASTTAATTPKATSAAGGGDDTTTTDATTTSKATASASTAAAAPPQGSTTTEATKFVIPDLPTKSPTVAESAAPTGAPTKKDWWQKEGDGADDDPNGAHVRMTTAFLAVVVVSIVFPGNVGNGLGGLGVKFAVAAAAASSLYSHSASKGGVRKSGLQAAPKSSVSSGGSGRSLATCNYNVEILLDGCSHSVTIDAPKGRVFDVTSVNQAQVTQPDDECMVDHTATIKPKDATSPKTENVNPELTVGVGNLQGMECAVVVAGRPFVDSSGGSLQASPLIAVDGAGSATVSWTGESQVVVETVEETSASNNSTARRLLGEDWTDRALAEHASVASFSAFSIALMTNSAPSDLVDDALRAGLDEVRHAKVSFDIATRLTGKEVGPGPLPPSRHQFGRDLEALALAVAREGCVDETLSAIAAAVEVEHINEVLEKGLQGSAYSNIDRDTLVFIRDELVTIAKDEGNHSALAWRTLGWVCSVDANACESVNENVFDESALETKFKRRAAGPFGGQSQVLDLMREEWTKIFDAHKLAQSDPQPAPSCVASSAEAGNDKKPLLTSLAESITHQMLCR